MQYGLLWKKYHETFKSKVEAYSGWKFRLNAGYATSEYRASLGPKGIFAYTVSHYQLYFLKSVLLAKKSFDFQNSFTG